MAKALNDTGLTALVKKIKQALSGKADTSSLATVATSGSYNDLSSKPTIPTVNNATLTIQKNGTNVATFTANASTGATANITVPTATSDLTNDSGFLGDADVSYDADSKTLIIGGGSVNTYTITFSDNADIVDMEINEQFTIYNGEPVEINEGDRFYCRVINTGNSGNTVVMGGVDITSSALTLITKDDGPITEYNCQISIPSVTGDVSIVVSSSNPYYN